MAKTHTRRALRSWIPVLSLLLLSALLSGCASGGAPVVDLYTIYNQNKPAAQPVTRGSHVVKRGETLYSIAFHYGWDFHALARANHIPKPYTIYPGQTIRFDRRFAATPRPNGQPASVVEPVRSTRTPRPEAVQRTEKHATPAAPEPAPLAATGAPVWQWPAAGKVIAHYGEAGSNKGIDIGGARGSKVVAAAAGVVVYRGHGLSGYGNLLIIKHNDDWLSAYAHNDTMLVQEGDQVQAGQTIATMGSTGTWQVQLYFEIRKDGKPVNPEKLLPPR